MKKSILTLILGLLCLASTAQFGITAGMNLASYSYAETRFDVHRKSLLAYNAGLIYKKELSGKAFLLPELNYALKGARVYYDYPIGFTGPMKNVNKFQYVQLNLPVVLGLPLSDEVDYEIGAGLFAACLVNAAQKTVEFDGSYQTRDFAAGDLKKLDTGLHFTTGFRMSKIVGFHFTYDLGLMNIQGHSYDPVAKTRNFSMGMSWLFTQND
jgi:hypothetical protein